MDCIPKNKAHQYRFKQEAMSDHSKHMHDNVLPMMAHLGFDWQLQDGAWVNRKDLSHKPLYNMEPLTISTGIHEAMVGLVMQFPRKIYDYDKVNVDVLKRYGADVEWRPLLLNQGVIDWVGHLDSNRPIDVLHIGNDFGPRKEIIEKLSACGLRFENVKGIYGKEASEKMKQAKVVINIHREGPTQAQEQVRINWAIACGCLVVSESSLKPSIPEPIIIEHDKDALFNGIMNAVTFWTFDDAMKRRDAYIKLSKNYQKNIWGIK